MARKVYEVSAMGIYTDQNPQAGSVAFNEALDKLAEFLRWNFKQHQPLQIRLKEWRTSVDNQPAVEVVIAIYEVYTK